MVETWHCIWKSMGKHRQWRVRVAWQRIKARIYSYKWSHRWRAVSGPISAMVVMLRDLGWSACRPDEWKPPTATWKLTPNMDIAPILSDIASSASTAAWAEASRYYNGEGLHGGADLTVIGKRLKAQRRKKDGAAGALGAIATASCWTQARKSATYDVDDLCPRCGLHPETDWHRHWQCPANHPDCPRARDRYLRLAERALLLENESYPCFWLRGLVPSEWTAVPPAPGPDQCPIHRSGDMTAKPGSRYYLDGSGGPSRPIPGFADVDGPPSTIITAAYWEQCMALWQDPAKQCRAVN